MLFPLKPDLVAAVHSRLASHFPQIEEENPDLLMATGLQLGMTMVGLVKSGRPLPPSEAAAMVYYSLSLDDESEQAMAQLRRREINSQGKKVGLPLIERMSTVVYAELMSNPEYFQHFAQASRPMVLHSLSCWADDALSMVWQAGRSVNDMVADAKSTLAKNVDVLIFSVESAGKRLTEALEKGVSNVYDGVVQTWDRLRGNVIHRAARVEMAFLHRKESVLSLVSNSLAYVQSKLTGMSNSDQARIDLLNRRMEPYLTMALRDAPISGDLRKEPSFTQTAPEASVTSNDHDNVDLDDMAMPPPSVMLSSHADDDAIESRPVKRTGFAALGMAY